MGNSNIIKSCEKHLPIHASNCSGFVNAVAKDFGIKLGGQANNIFNTLNNGVIPGTISYGNGLENAKRSAKDAAEGKSLIIGASISPNGHGHVAIIVGLDPHEKVLVYGGMLDHPEKASKKESITSKAWAKYKLSNTYIIAEPPSFFGIPILPPFIG